MKYLASTLCLLLIPLSAEAEQPERKVVKPPVVKSVPRDFTRPQVKKPAGFGKQNGKDLNSLKLGLAITTDTEA